MIEIALEHGPDGLGILAGILVLATFNTTNFRRLRALAVASNLAFIAYGAALTLWPVIVLHGLLLPVNLWHLAQMFRRSGLNETLPKLPPPPRAYPRDTRQRRWAARPVALV